MIRKMHGNKPWRGQKREMGGNRGRGMFNNRGRGGPQHGGPPQQRPNHGGQMDQMPHQHFDSRPQGDNQEYRRGNMFNRGRGDGSYRGERNFRGDGNFRGRRGSFRGGPNNRQHNDRDGDFEPPFQGPPAGSRFLVITQEVQNTAPSNDFESTKIGNKRRKVLKGQPSVTPMCASECLRELCPDYTVTIKNGDHGKPYLAITDIGDGKQYKGFGTHVELANEASIEAALISFLQLPAQSPEEDKTPWGVFTSFAIYRLLKEWRDVKSRTYDSEELQIIKEITGTMPFRISSCKSTTPTKSAPVPISQRLGIQKPKVVAEENESENTPLLKLKELAPELNNDCFIFIPSMKANNTAFIGCTLKLREKSFFGEGPEENTAKINTAKLALKELFDVVMD